MASNKPKKPKIKEANFFGLKHDWVNKEFEGDLTHVGDVCLETGQTVAVYRAAKPNKKKGHKEFMLLQLSNRGGVVAGMTHREMKKHAKHAAAHCLNCNTILYSVHRHHFHTCNCPNNTFVDGGKDYLRTGAMDMSKVVTGTLNVLTKKFTPSKT